MNIVTIPTHMIRNNLQNGEILESFLMKDGNIQGVRFYGLTESLSARCKGMSSYKNFDIFDYYFASPKKRLSENDKKLLYDISQNFTKDNFCPTSRYETSTVDVATLIKSTSFFQIQK